MSINTLIKIFIVSTTLFLDYLIMLINLFGLDQYHLFLNWAWMLTSYVPTQNMTVTEFAGLTGDKLTNVGGFDIKRLIICYSYNNVNDNYPYS